ncbi:MAG: HU family DNA-binding protein [Aggregatilineales bacterium]
MKKSDFVAEFGKKTGMTHAKADKAVNAVLDLITETLKKGDKLTLTGFGSFEVRARAARPGRDIRTKQKITIPASKRPVFSAGAVFKAAVSGKPAAKLAKAKKK